MADGAEVGSGSVVEVLPVCVGGLPALEVVVWRVVEVEVDPSVVCVVPSKGRRYDTVKESTYQKSWMY